MGNRNTVRWGEGMLFKLLSQMGYSQYQQLMEIILPRPEAIKLISFAAPTQMQ